MTNDAFHWLQAIAIDRKQLDAVGSTAAVAFADRLRTATTTDRFASLITCERIEAYGTQLPQPPAELRATHLQGVNAVRRLMRIAAGLESRLVGESHVLGQVRRAIAQAAPQAANDPRLRRLFDRAIRTGRRVRTRTAIGSLADNYPRLAIQAVLNNTGDGITLGVIGAGIAARDVIACARDPRITKLLVFGRHPERTARAASLHQQGAALSLTTLDQHIHSLDAIITAAGASRPVVTANTLTLGAAGRLRTAVDLGEPSNCEPIDPAILTVKALADLAPTDDHSAAITEATWHIERELDAFCRNEATRNPVILR